MTAGTRSRLSRWAMPILVAMLTVAAFFPALQNGFVDWDDNTGLLNNLSYRGLGWEQLRWMFTTFHLGHYQPLTWVTFGLDYLVWGMDPFGYHLTNLLLHALNAVVFYFVALRLFSLSVSVSSGDFALRAASGFAALLFSIHPLRVESVAWATERRDVLSGLFFLLTLLCYLRAAKADSGAEHLKWLGVAVLAYVFSLLAKDVGMMLPSALKVLDVYPLMRFGAGGGKWFGPEAQRIWWEKAPFAFLALVAAAVAIMAQSVALKSFAVHDSAGRLAQALFGLGYYLRKTLLPVGLSPIYELPRPFIPWDWPYLASGLAVSAIAAGLIILRCRWPAGLAAGIYYAAMLAPVLGIAQSGSQLVADRYSYLSCLGWALLAGGGYLCLQRRWL
ncbi:MAG: hypothetical protein ACRD2R_00405, partial [Terriglobales bacterium]